MECHLLYAKQSEDGLRSISFHRLLLDYHHTDKPSTYLHLKIVYIRSGEAVWQIGNARIRAAAGDFIILNSSECRHFLDVLTPEGLLMEYITFSPLGIFTNNCPLQIFFCRCPTFSNVVPRAEWYADSVRAFYAIASEVDKPGAMQDEAIYGHLLTLLVNIARSYETDASISAQLHGMTEQLSLQNYNLICQAMVYIDQHFTEKLRESQIAHQLGLSVSHFSRMFHRFMGVTFTDYLRRLRLNRALERLRSERQQNILTVALECGFGSSAGFYKAVRELTGSTTKELIGRNSV